MTTPSIVAHRGWPSRYPENTLRSLAAALDRGARAIEIDLQLTRDSAPVLFHDRDLARCTGARGSVADLDLVSIRELSAHVPALFGERFAGTRIPTLASAVSLLADHTGVHLFAEIKRVSIERFGRDAVLAAILPELEALRERCTVISFDRSLIADLLAAGRYECGWIIESWDDASIASANELSPQFLFADVKILPAGATPLPVGDWRWVVYVVDDAAGAMAWAGRGARFVETDDCGPVLEAMAAGEDGP